MKKTISKKLATFGSVLTVGVIAVCATTSMAGSTITGSNEYIVININGKDMTFPNHQKAVEYILAHNIKVDQQMKVGTPKYLDKTNGIIDQDSIFDYVADNNHVKPAYKMMNGKYTYSREKALNTFLGRTHLVAQYYDGVNMHEGNSIGLKEAKQAIMNRQKSTVVPWQDVRLSSDEVMRINPFSQEDIKALQKRSLQIYKENLSNNGNASFKNVNAAYLLPTAKGGSIGIVPENQNKGLTLSDLIDYNKIGNLFKEWVKNELIRFDFKASIQGFDGWEENPYKFIYSHKKYIKGLTLNSKLIKFNNMDYSTLMKYKDSVTAFLSYRGFWDVFDEIKHENYDAWSTSTNFAKIFGTWTQVKNTKKERHTRWRGFDVSINENGSGYGSWYAHTTKGSLVAKKNPNIDKNRGWVQIFKEYLLGTNGEKIQNLLKQQFKGVFSQHILQKIIGDGIFKGIDTKEINNITEKNLKEITCINISEGNMKKNDGKIYIPSITDKIFGIPGIINQIKNKKVELSNEKLLLVNGTPITSLDSKGNFNNITIYNNIHYTNLGESTSKNSGSKKYYLINQNINNWAQFMKSNDFKDVFSFKVGSKSKEIDYKKFGSFKGNLIYGSNSIPPLIMLKESGAPAKYSETSYKNINLSKILVSKIDEIHALNTRDRENGFFNNDIDLKERIKEINNDFFDPELTYVIYNDNDEIIDAFKSEGSNLRFDDKETIKHNAKAILSKYMRKDLNVFYVKDKDGHWTKEPVGNESFMIYNINWKNKTITFDSFENVAKFVNEWVKVNAKTIIMKG